MRIMFGMGRAPVQLRPGRVQKFLGSFLRKKTAVALFVLFAPAVQAAPQLVPTRDVSVEYVVTPRDHRPIAVHVAIEGGGQHLRIAGEDLPTAFLVDRGAGTATILLPLLKLYTTVGIGRFDPERTILRGARFERHGERFLAGLTCTDWSAFSPQGHANACITPDGVILAGTASDRSGELGTVRATTVAYGALAPVLFRRPDGYHDAGAIPLDGLVR